MSYIPGDEDSNTLEGTLENDEIYGYGGDDSLYGLAGNDYLDGGVGTDTLTGGAGDDTYVVDSTGDVVTEASGAGIDRINSCVDYTLSSNVEDLYLYDSAKKGYGNTLDNAIHGNGNKNTLFGDDGNDDLYGDDGDDRLSGGTGNDNMYGGAGSDKYYVHNSGDSVFEDLNAGTDLIYAYVSYTLPSNVENLNLYRDAKKGYGNTLDNWIYGNDNQNTLYGDDGNDHLYDNVGDDTLNGGSGDDYMYGGVGSDTYYVDSPGDKVIDFDDSGTDRVKAYIDYKLPSGVENLYLYGNAEYGYGNAHPNKIVGNSNDNILYGYNGSDSLYGLDGDDILDAGGGYDYMAGGAGNDIYYVESEDTIYETKNAGRDRVYTYAARTTLSPNVEYLYLYGDADEGYGNTLDNGIYGNYRNNYLDGDAGNDHLYGDDGNDRLNGGEGNDYMSGGAGNDKYYIDSPDDTVREKANAGTDKVNAYADYTLPSNVENLSLYRNAEKGYGNSLANRIVGNGNDNALCGYKGNDSLYGYDGSDALYGHDGKDALYGHDGNDILDAGTGNDFMSGGSGADCFDFTTAPNSTTNIDMIHDFSSADDTIRLENSIMTGLGTTEGILAAGAFQSGIVNVATEPDDRILYNTSTGALFYDEDGTGSTEAVQIAVIGETSHPALTNTDFLVI